MKTIRKGVFETNSSSSHSITVITFEEYEEWKNNPDEYLMSVYDDKLILREEAVKIVTEIYKDLSDYNSDDIDSYLRDEEYLSFGEFFDEYYEVDIEIVQHTTKSGDEIVIVSRYDIVNNDIFSYF